MAPDAARARRTNRELTRARLPSHPILSDQIPVLVPENHQVNPYDRTKIIISGMSQVRRSTAPTRSCAPSWTTRRVGYVLAIGCDRRIPTQAGLIRADEIAADLPRRAWQRLSAGAGARGQRYYDWALISRPDPTGAADPGRHPVLVATRAPPPRHR
ncbi:hypothetical protein PSA01_54790 [Pseudonocardia saturnea]|uniref:Uncharacterized protein n=1 Tax=Pseudonocardia saturnea TaxID=33909 RepID=A0ABQ0S6A9_9PSEU|nr:hypothetical protein Pdca_15780 [Pseudonocardia autotrophica]GEC28450.1 hypothetical protein PSA01_54790 [Pseudonocardia saturnea]